MKTGRDDWDAMIKVAGIPSDEPVFLLRGQNHSAARTVRAWAEFELQDGTPICVVEQALRQADAMEKWPVKKEIGAAHLTEAEQKQLAYANARRVWNGGRIPREALAGALMLDLIEAIQELPEGAAHVVDLKARAEALNEVLTAGRGTLRAG